MKAKITDLKTKNHISFIMTYSQVTWSSKVPSNFKTPFKCFFLTMQYWRKVIFCLISESSIIFLLSFFFHTDLQHGVLLTQQTAVFLTFNLWKHTLNYLRSKRIRDVFLTYLSNCKGNLSINATDFELVLWQLNSIDYFPSFSKFVFKDFCFPLSSSILILHIGKDLFI